MHAWAKGPSEYVMAGEGVFVLIDGIDLIGCHDFIDDLLDLPGSSNVHVIKESHSDVMWALCL